MALDCGRRSFDQLSMSKSFCSSVSLTGRVHVAAEGDCEGPLRVLVEDDRGASVVAPCVVVEGENPLHLHADRVVLGTLELVDALLLEQVRDEKLLLQHSDCGVHELLGLDDLVLCGGNVLSSWVIMAKCGPEPHGW